MRCLSLGIVTICIAAIFVDSLAVQTPLHAPILIQSPCPTLVESPITNEQYQHQDHAFESNTGRHTHISNISPPGYIQANQKHRNGVLPSPDHSATDFSFVGLGKRATDQSHDAPVSTVQLSDALSDDAPQPKQPQDQVSTGIETSNLTSTNPTGDAVVAIGDKLSAGNTAFLNDHKNVVFVFQIVGAVLGACLVGMVAVSVVMANQPRTLAVSDKQNDSVDDVEHPVSFDMQHFIPVSSRLDMSSGMLGREDDSTPTNAAMFSTTPSDISTVRRRSLVESVCTIEPLSMAMSTSFADTEIEFDLFQRPRFNSQSSSFSTRSATIPIVMPIPTRPGASVASRITATLDAEYVSASHELFEHSIQTLQVPRQGMFLDDTSSDGTNSITQSDIGEVVEMISFLPKYPSPTIGHCSTIMDQLEASLNALDRGFDDSLYSSVASRYRRRNSMGASTMSRSNYNFNSTGAFGHSLHQPHVRNRWLTTSSSGSSADSISDRSDRSSWSISLSNQSICSGVDIPIASQSRRFSLSVLPLPMPYQSPAGARYGSNARASLNSEILTK
ncbi:hypothetical protein QVD99_000841 [Batrachochytrium dendrobatidis]|nr:hypothetical protein O5D80_003690 [Batrachochytrium dendrobatidis]KAK5673392.1 hypothetical protein QVD99_000841 [Batrachochytrium dendrobatidis]